ncbi:Alpha/Beta hydrolase protein [Lasiosphaeria ovina]|uniref:Alpha/Beta hydrolase protein n=1 Tax=Lasiosphaeria ovina TaxID=92902 RepID=A0AAE0KAN8_9PEZI|nr:Alpha/Beta hydrolase protein [Lasiosphaeria ovina]
MDETTLITINPAATVAHTHTVIFLHGRGDSAPNFSTSLKWSTDSRGRSLIAAFPSFRWVFPQAPLRPTASDPRRLPFRQWFDTFNVRDLARREDVQAPGLREAAPAIHHLLAREAVLLNGRYDRIVLAGISMGAATSAHVLFNMPDLPPEASSTGGLAAMMGFSGRCPFVGRTLREMREVLAPLEGEAEGGSGVARAEGDESAVLRGTPVLLEHCVDDPLVAVENGRLLRDAMASFGARVEWKEYAKGGHWFQSPQGIDDAIEFLERHVLGAGSG